MAKKKKKSDPAAKAAKPAPAAKETKKAKEDKALKKRRKDEEKLSKKLEKQRQKLQKKAQKAAAKGDAAMPVEIKTGKGATPGELGHALVTRFNQGKADTKGSMYSDELISIEGVGVSAAWVGMKAVDAKNAWWSARHRIHGASAEGPFVGATGFAVRFRMDVEEIETGKRTQMEEVGVYTVEDGKIVREEFMYRA